jgi:hypothetical protein
VKWVVINPVAVEKLAHFDFAKTALRQEALQTIFPSLLDILNRPIFDFLRKTDFSTATPVLDTYPKTPVFVNGRSIPCQN